MVEIIFVCISAVILVLVVIIVLKARKQFRDKSVDITPGMDEGQVREIMEKDPLSINPLKDDCYDWIYERRQWKGWGTMVLTIEVVFDPTKHVREINYSTSYEKSNPL